MLGVLLTWTGGVACPDVAAGDGVLLFIETELLLPLLASEGPRMSASSGLDAVRGGEGNGGSDSDCGTGWVDGKGRGDIV